MNDLIKNIDKLDKIFDKQKELQGKMPEKVPFGEVSDWHWQEAINQFILAGMIELAEAAQVTQWKNPERVKFGWKRTQQLKLEKFKEELVDCIHFVVNLCLIAGMDANEVFDRYMNKNKVNVKRQEDEY